MKLTILGSGTAAPEPHRVGSCYFLEAGDLNLLLDCGPGGIHHAARFGVDWAGITHVLLTHFHNDHIGDLPYLFFAWRWGTVPPRSTPVTLVGPVGTGDLVARLGDVFGSHVAEPEFPLQLHEVQHGETLLLGSDVELSVHQTPHTVASVAYRIAWGGASVAYTGDTDHDSDLAAFLAGVDILVTECSLPDEEHVEGHLTPSRLAALARVAQPGRLVVSHVYPQLDRLGVPALLTGGGWDGAVVRARDGLVLGTDGSVDESSALG